MSMLRAFWLGWRRCARLFSALAGNGRACRSVELRALCNEVPRTPPGPEGSNGTGNASGAADHPEFLSLKQFSVISCQFSVRKKSKDAKAALCPFIPKTVYSGQLSVFTGKIRSDASESFSALFTENCLQLSVFSESNAAISEAFFLY